MDWDECTAFCNIPRGDLTILRPGMLSSLACWVADHQGCSRLGPSPHTAPALPCPCLTAGPKTTPGGVALFTPTSAVCMLAREVVCQWSLHPCNLSSLTTDIGAPLCSEPARPPQSLGEIFFSNHCRFFAATVVGAILRRPWQFSPPRSLFFFCWLLMWVAPNARGHGSVWQR